MSRPEVLKIAKAISAEPRLLTPVKRFQSRENMVAKILIVLFCVLLAVVVTPASLWFRDLMSSSPTSMRLGANLMFSMALSGAIFLALAFLANRYDLRNMATLKHDIEKGGLGPVLSDATGMTPDEFVLFADKDDLLEAISDLAKYQRKLSVRLASGIPA